MHKEEPKISIHTTTRVVTPYVVKVTVYDAISIHTTTRVVTGLSQESEDETMNFNPHHYESGDQTCTGQCQNRTYFNPHHYESGDNKGKSAVTLYDNFNPHHYESGDRGEPGIQS